MTEPCDLSAVEARRLIGRKALSPVELLESCLARIGEVNHAVNAMVAMDEPAARAGAKAAEQAVMKGETLGALHGLPVGIKDLEETKGLRTTYGSPIFADFVPEADCGMVANLRKAGAIVIGKTNTPEFGAGANTRNAVYGVTGNPFDPTKSAAGSSGGSGVALACGMAPICSGSDTGGSLRNPAAFNGIVGYRPSPGLVPSEKRGHGWSGLPVLGPMARNMQDTALMLSAMASDDAQDPLAYTLHGAVGRGVADMYYPVKPIDLGSLRLAVSADFGQAPVEKHIREVFATRARAIAPMFGAADEASPDCRGGDEAFEVLRATGFLTSHLEKARTRPQDVGPNVRANVEEGLRYTIEDAARAAAQQTRMYRAWQHFFARHDILITPAITVSPRPWKELYPAEIDGQPTRTYFHWLAMAYYVTLCGHPAVSIPMGVDRNGMPFGLQVVGPRGGDALLLRVAAAIEEAFVNDPELRRPVPDLAALKAAPPVKEMPGAVGWD
ncbi:amidase [Neoroseomonas soli]|uniref:Amidase n=1 Tax=Neoroseomonas soli TaxID=1081025 RepID=A0A9X9WVE3_9PROT|nr:amidase family protein [Neoroseomonas soli]MBR0671122.1 amidase [Neoroseomonas soli]